MGSQEVLDAIGEAPSTADLLAAKVAELHDAEQACAAAELAFDIQRTVALQNEVAVLRQFIEKLTARVTVEAMAEAREEAVALDQKLYARYTDALAQLMPDIDVARKAIKAVTDAVRRCAKTWNQASRAKFELQLLGMRFALEPTPLDVLPVSPVAALSAAFSEEMVTCERLCRQEMLPPTGAAGGDSQDRLAAKGMLAAATFVATYGQDMKLSRELRGIFENAGPVPDLRATARRDDAVIPGTTLALPLGAYGSAMAPYGPNESLSPKQAEARDQKRRANTRREAATLRVMGEDAARIAADDARIRQGKPVKNSPAPRDDDDGPAFIGTEPTPRTPAKNPLGGMRG